MGVGGIRDGLSMGFLGEGVQRARAATPRPPSRLRPNANGVWGEGAVLGYLWPKRGGACVY